MIIVLHIVACTIIFILFDDRDWLGGVLRLMKIVHFLVFFVVFGQVKEWFMLEIHKIIRLSHIYPCSIAFLLIFDQGCRGGVFKVMKKDFFQCFQPFGTFPQVFRQVKECLILQLHEMIRAIHEFACPSVFILFQDRIDREECSCYEI